MTSAERKMAKKNDKPMEPSKVMISVQLKTLLLINFNFKNKRRKDGWLISLKILFDETLTEVGKKKWMKSKKKIVS